MSAQEEGGEYIAIREEVVRGEVMLIGVVPLTFNRARLVIGPVDVPVYDDVW